MHHRVWTYIKRPACLIIILKHYTLKKCVFKKGPMYCINMNNLFCIDFFPRCFSFSLSVLAENNLYISSFSVDNVHKIRGYMHTIFFMLSFFVLTEKKIGLGFTLKHFPNNYKDRIK